MYAAGHNSSSRRRWSWAIALKIAIALCLGFASTVAFAWFPPFSRSKSGTFAGYEAPRRIPGALKLHRFSEMAQTTYSVEGRGPVPEITFGELEGAMGSIAPIPPGWSDPEWTVLMTAFGWPMRSLCWISVHRLGVDGQTGQEEYGQIDIAPGRNLWIKPCLPIWSGLFFDTALFGAGWAGLVFVPGYIRRLALHRRGRCSRCTYDLRHNFTGGCPECGWNRPTSPPPPATPSSPPAPDPRASV